MWSKKNNITRLLKARNICFLAFFMIVTSVSSQCVIKEIPFQAGEQLNYDVYYYMKKMWVPAGKVRFEVYDSLYNGKSCFMLDGKGKSLKSYDYFFRVRDQYASWVDKETLIPYRFLRDVSEGGFELFEDYRFSPKEQKAVVYTHKTDTTKRTTMKVPSCTFDVMTCVYRARCIDFFYCQTK
jgi:hypothetical protein